MKCLNCPGNSSILLRLQLIILTNALFLFSSLFSFSEAYAAKVAVYVTGGANAETVLALCRTVAATGHTVYGISNDDVNHGRLTTANFDLLILPPGQDGSPTLYNDSDYGLGASGAVPAIKSFVTGGGGLIGIEAGAQFASLHGLYGGAYLPWTNTEDGYPFAISDPVFGSGSQELYMSATGGYFSLPMPPGATTILTNSLGNTSAVRTTYGSGRVILMAPNPTLRGDSDLDWTIWDNWVMNGTHENSSGAWKLFGRMINWVHTGNATQPVIYSDNPAGERVAIVSSYIFSLTYGYGGAWPGLLPAVGRAVENSGHIPLSIRFQDVTNGRLTVNNFGAVVFPGGKATGYITGLSGYEDSIRNFVNSGGCYLGICAGSFYASSEIEWEGSVYDYPLDLFSGQDIGPIKDLSADPGGDDWTYWTLTDITINDTVLGNIGTQKQFYLGGGYKTTASGVTPVATYADPGSSSYGTTDAIRFSYGMGRVLLSGAHPEVRSGSNADWLFWDNYYHNSTTSLTNPDNPWLFVDTVFNKWFFPASGISSFPWTLFLPAIILNQ